MKYLVLVLMLTTTSAFAKGNRLSVLGGYGAQKGFTGETVGLHNSPTQRLGKESYKTGVVTGVQYQRVIGGDMEVGAQYQTNDTVSVLFGVNF